MISPSELLSTLQREIARRIEAEAALQDLSQGPDQTEIQLRAQLSRLIQARDAETQQAAEEYEAVRSHLVSEFSSAIAELEAEHRDAVRNIETAAGRAAADLERQRDESAWVVTSVLDDTAEDSPAREFERFKALLQKSKDEQIAEWTNIDTAVRGAMEYWNWSESLPMEPADPPRDRDAAQVRFTESVAETRRQLKKLNSLLLPRLFRGFRSLFVFVVLTAGIGVPFWFFVDPLPLGVSGGRLQPSWLGLSSAAGALGGLLLSLVLYTLGSMRQSELFRRLQDLKGEVHWVHQHWLRLAKEQLSRQQKEFEVQQRRIERDRQQALRRYETAHEQRLREIETDKTNRLSQEQQQYNARRAELLGERDRQLAAVDQEHVRRSAELAERWTRDIEQSEAELHQHVTQRRRILQEHWLRLKSDWEQGWRAFESGLREENEASAAHFAHWSQLADGNWTPPQKIPEAIRLGDYEIDLSTWEGAVSQDVRLAPRVTRYRLPCTIPFPQATSVLLKSPTQQARGAAIDGLQSLMLRLLTLVPPGKLRFTIIDPVGLGESFGGFMHLTDYDELLVTSRIWTEAGQIEARLADLTEHMENVLQKYLRNEFQTIEEYNESAGEVAEPYHVLVISDFPAKFSEIAARRLVSIVNSGPRCGVYTLMNLEPGKQLPNNFSLDDIQTRMTRFEWRSGSFHSLDEALARWPLAIDAPPPPDQFTSIVKMIGEASKDARRVEVSFDRIAPAPKDVWSGDSRAEIAIPLGRAGATKLQQLRLGKGTSQHMLVAGKTGSGKSTFLHILITNLALHYSPDEVNFYLIDFKKGVEFKDYATHQLPHARVIAVESDREFGVSALQRLDEVLQERGELFRKHGVQDIAGYRKVTGRPLPRILLVVDEFQEFFVEDDKIGQNAALLLDRLVRQGRAFGMHVILGSQTLGGAYSLARSTLGQVAVRVALQCSEADAHLILSEDNTAARLLTRPGEALYNDANGMLEGNHPFQIAWISDAQREQALELIRERVLRRGLSVEPAIVFEGNIPSDLTRNSDIARLIDGYSTREEPLPAPTIWLGDAVEIAPATTVMFHRQSGSHLLLVGQDADAALGVMAAAFTALAASLSAKQQQNSLFVLDGSHAGSAEFEAWKQLTSLVPVDARLIRPDETAPFLQAMAAELKRREAENDVKAAPIFLLIYNLARFRDLRKAEDDFGLGSFGGPGLEKPPDPGKLFADLLAQGPAFGLHTIIWCDSYNNIDRWFSRQSLRELELRIAFQMNAADSSNLIDSPAASRLGTHRALLYREETGTAEKFRPYGFPPVPWLESVRQRMLHGPGTDLLTDLEEFSII